jgi:transcription termination factor NusB
VTSQGARAFSGTRSVARKLALQALYRWQLNAAPWQDLVHEFDAAEVGLDEPAERLRGRPTAGGNRPSRFENLIALVGAAP